MTSRTEEDARLADDARLVVDIEEVVFDTPTYAEITKLRRELLRKPLGLDFSVAELALERHDRHLAAIARGRVVGTLLLRAVDERTTRLMRMAVAENVQCRGVGRTLVEHAERLLRRAGGEEIFMHARATAAGFYARLGYRCVGEEFLEQGISHIRMVKRLDV